MPRQWLDDLSIKSFIYHVMSRDDATIRTEKCFSPEQIAAIRECWEEYVAAQDEGEEHYEQEEQRSASSSDVDED